MLNSKNFWKNKKVLVIGSGGFKGKWLVIFLNHLGAKVIGINKTKIKDINYKLYTADIYNHKKINNVFKKEKPEIVFHLAAQPIVSESYKNPIETYKTNIFGLLNVLEIIKKSKFVKSSIIVTSDKCYKIDKKKINRPLTEDSSLGGNDPYSASKACAEIITSSYYNSFLSVQEKKRGLATVRAGNVVGGGDWSKDRIIPDIIQSIKKKKKIRLRNPHSKRPWQYILDVLYGYLILSEKLYSEPSKFYGGWNFAKDYKKKSLNVKEVLQIVCKEFNYNNSYQPTKVKFHEEKKYIISGAKSKLYLNWNPIYNHNQSIKLTAKWYKSYMYNKFTEFDLIRAYCKDYLIDLKKTKNN